MIRLNRIAMTLVLSLMIGLLLYGCGKKTANQPAETSAPQQPITITPPSPAIPGAPGAPGAPGITGAPGAAAVQAPRFVPRYAMSAGRKDPFAPVVGRRPEPPPPPPDISSVIGPGLPQLPGTQGPGGIPMVAPPPLPPVTVQVTGIMRAGGKVMAILKDGEKNEVVGLGDKFGEYTVQAIKKKTVVLKGGGRVVKLGIPEN